MLIGMATASLGWRTYALLVACAVSIIVFRYQIQHDFSLATVPHLMLQLLHVYLFLLWLMPREAWNFLGGIVFFVNSILVVIFPDLPTFIDDCGAIFALFGFIFLYIHTLASLMQRIVDVPGIKGCMGTWLRALCQPLK